MGFSPSDNDIIVVFADRVEGWQLGIAEEMLRQIEDSSIYPAMKHAGYALISVVFLYFEMIGQCVNPTGGVPSPTVDFVRGFRDVDPNTPFSDHEIEIVYDRIRCGMYHNGYRTTPRRCSGCIRPAGTACSQCVRYSEHTRATDQTSAFAGGIGASLGGVNPCFSRIRARAKRAACLFSGPRTR